MTKERNTPRDIAFDMEDPISQMSGHLNVLNALTAKGDQRTASAEWKAARSTYFDIVERYQEIRDWHQKLVDAFNRQAEPTAGEKSAAVPATNTAQQFDGRKQWSAIYARWLTLQATWAEREAAEDVSDEDGGRLLDEETALVLELSLTSPALPWQVAQKVGVLEKYMERSNWSDRRDEVLLASIRHDLEALS